MMIAFIISILFFFTKTTSIRVENDSVQPPRQNNNILNNKTQTDCFKESKVLFQGVCHKLLTSEACHNDGEWLVLDYNSTRRPNDILLSKCVKKPCTNGKFYWPVDGECYSNSSDGNLCPRGKELHNDVFGDGICDCILIPPHESANDGTCYQLYTRGPCEERWVFVKLQNRVQCIPDRCHLQTVSSVNKTYIFWEKTRKCYSIDDRGPCGEGKVLKIDPQSKIPICSVVVLPTHLVDLPQTCSTDHQDNCHENIVIKNPDEAFVTSLLLQADKKRKSKRKL